MILYRYMYLFLALFCASTGILSAQGVQYVNREKHYAFVYPEDWSKMENAQGADILIASPPNSLTGMPDANVSINSKILPPNWDKENFYVNRMDELRDQFPGFGVDFSGEINIAGVDAKFIQYTYQSQDNVEVTVRQYLFTNNNIGYILSMASVSDDWGIYLPVMSSMMASFQFIQ